MTVIPRSLLRPKAWLYAWNAPRRTDTTLGSPAEAHCADAEGGAVATGEAAFEEDEEDEKDEEGPAEAAPAGGVMRGAMRLMRSATR